MKHLLTLSILLTQSLVLASCGQKPELAKQLKKQAVEIQDFVNKAQHEKDTEQRKNDAFMQLGRHMTPAQFQDYVARISDDDPTNDQEVR